MYKPETAEKALLSPTFCCFHVFIALISSFAVSYIHISLLKIPKTGCILR